MKKAGEAVVVKDDLISSAGFSELFRRPGLFVPAPAPSHVDCCKACEVQRIAAERELSAFVKAVELLFGKVESLRAGEYWLTLAENADIPMTDGYAVWRDITIQAADCFTSTIIQLTHYRRPKEGTSVS